MNLSETKKAVTLPAKVITVPPWYFSPAWSERPTTDVRMGIRAPSVSDLQTARAVAEDKARQNQTSQDLRVDAYNDALVCWVVARGTCRTDDASKPFFTGAEDTVPVAFTPAGVRAVFEAVEAVYLAHSPIYPEVHDTELLCSMLQNPEAWAALPEKQQRRIRRLLGYIMDSFTAEG